VDLDDSNSGTGVSVNKLLRNVNWIATPGGRLFFSGEIAPDETLNVETAVRTMTCPIHDFDRVYRDDVLRDALDQRQRTLDAYHRYIEAQLADTEAKILQLRALEAAKATPAIRTRARRPGTSR
jgi:hypothetical protein